MQLISTEDLNVEFTNWVRENRKNSRNNQDLRFSQHIYNTYDLSNIEGDGYYIESTERFYLFIIKSLLCKEIVKTNKLKKIEA